MKRLVYSLAVVSIIAILISCSSGASSPEQLGKKVVNSLKQNDVDSYLKLCGNSRDMIYLLKKSDLSKEEKEHELQDIKPRQKEFDKDMEEDRRENFADIHEEYLWKTAKVDHVETGELRKRDGISYFKDIHVYIIGGMVLEIDAVIKTPRGWLIMDDVALSLD